MKKIVKIGESLEVNPTSVGRLLPLEPPGCSLRALQRKRKDFDWLTGLVSKHSDWWMGHLNESDWSTSPSR